MKMLDENSHLIQTIQEYQSKGKAQECMQYQQILHRNLVYLASIADANQNIQALLPPPGMHVPPGPGQGGTSPSPSGDMPPNPQGPMGSFGQQQGGYRGQMIPGQQSMPQQSKRARCQNDDML
uniref:SS18 N-terminal domain-containing protein n=1 Tax=Timema shepardi TaxID=629360 RepID=A0A7R9AP33_TIMSH|nr:unnamed protein product [Timema shepardi]